MERFQSEIEQKNKQNKSFKIAILGGGTAGWMAANLFAKKWADKNVEISLVESPSVGIIGVGEGSTPTLKRFFEMLDIAESDWMPACNATYKVNIRFDDWSPASGIKSYSHPFTTQVDVFTSRAFHVNCRTRRLGLDTNVTPENFLLNGVLANQGKTPVTPENFPFKMEYGYHFDSGLLGKFLADIAIKNGVHHIQAHVDDVEKHNNGDIAALHISTESNASNCASKSTSESVHRSHEETGKITADFFVDCSGFSSKLMQKTLGVKFNSFKENLFNDSAVVMPTTTTNQSRSVETVSTALSAGWCWKIPLKNRFGNGYVYSSDFINQEQAEQEFRRHLNQVDSMQDCQHLKMKVGQLQQHWSHNCLGLGLSQGFIEPLEATALHLVQVGIEHFINKFEQGDFSAQHRAQYNQDMTERFERVRDYIVAHYKLNTRDDSEYWRANRENTHISSSLSHILNVWYKREDLAQEITRQNLSTHFDVTSWHCLLAGYGAFPPLQKGQPGKGDLYLEQGIEKFLQGCALNFSKAR